MIGENHAIGYITLIKTRFGVFATRRVVAKSDG
jgi:hypothetical protein